MLLNSLKVSVLLYFWSVREIKLLISSPLKLYAWTLHHKYLIGSKSSYKKHCFLLGKSQKMKDFHVFLLSQKDTVYVYRTSPVPVFPLSWCTIFNSFWTVKCCWQRFCEPAPCWSHFLENCFNLKNQKFVVSLWRYFIYWRFHKSISCKNKRKQKLKITIKRQYFRKDWADFQKYKKRSIFDEVRKSNSNKVKCKFYQSIHVPKSWNNSNSI